MNKEMHLKKDLNLVLTSRPFPLIAFTEAIICAEVALKSILIKYELFTEQDKHHKIPKLFTKIKSEQCLPSAKNDKLSNIIGNRSKGGLGYIKISSPLDIQMQTTAGHYTDLRYPIDTSLPYEMVKQGDAADKIKEVEQLIEVISPIFSN